VTCQTCDLSFPTDNYFCPRCGTPAGSPPVAPGANPRGVYQVGLAAIVAVGAVVLTDLVITLFPLVGQMMAEHAMATGNVDLLNQAALIELFLFVPYLLAWITAGTLVIIWLWRARSNVDAFPGAEQGMRAGWAIGGWFIPFANLVIPYKVMSNVARVSLWPAEPLAKRTVPTAVNVWWVAYVLAGCIGFQLSRTDARAYEELPDFLATPADFQLYVDYYQAALWRLLPSLLLLAVAAAALTWLILKISRAQEDRIARGRPGPLTYGAVVPTAPPPDGGTIGP
jgi:hypothetical protein